MYFAKEVDRGFWCLDCVDLAQDRAGVWVEYQVLGVPDNHGYGESSPEVDGVVLISLS